MGLQAYDDKLLSLLGRRHTVSDFLRAWEDLRRAGFDNLNLDLIANVPSQSLEDFIAGAKRALALLPEHVSFYSLQIEEGTAFWRDGVRTDDDLARAMGVEKLGPAAVSSFIYFESFAAMQGFRPVDAGRRHGTGSGFSGRTSRYLQRALRGRGTRLSGQ